MGHVADEVDLLTWAGTALLWSITRLKPGAGAAIPFAVPPAPDSPLHWVDVEDIMRANNAPESLERRLGRVEVPQDRYRADIDLHERSIQFSAELVRMALAGIAVVGFLVAQLPEHLRSVVFNTLRLKALLSGSVIAFAASAGFALLHRFFAGGAAFHHLQVIKLLLLDDAQYTQELDREMGRRTMLFLRCHRFLKLASGLLVAGAGLLGAAFILALFA